MKTGIITLLTVLDSRFEGGLVRIISFDTERLEFVFGYKPDEKFSSYNALRQKEIDAAANTLKLTHSGKPLLGQSGVMELSAALRTFVEKKAWRDEVELSSVIEHFWEIAQRHVDANSTEELVAV